MHLYFRLPQFNSNFLFYCKLIAIQFFTIYIYHLRKYSCMYFQIIEYIYNKIYNTIAYLSLYNQFYKN